MPYGPKPTPLEIAALHGRQRSKLRARGLLPKGRVIDATIDPPKHLSADEAREWRAVEVKFADLQMITTNDLVLLEAWCVFRGDLVESERHLKRGTIVTDKNGEKRRSPWYLVRNRAIEGLQKIGAEFGFSPGSR